MFVNSKERFLTKVKEVFEEVNKKKNKNKALKNK
jgi:hypothetical protein